MQSTQGTTGQQSTGAGGMGLRLQDVETPEQRQLVDDVSRAIQVCEWCADQCIQEADPGMIECVRLCRDVATLGTTVLELLPRNSRYAQSALQPFQQAVQACARECGAHHHAHCQECAEVLGWTTQSIQEYQGTGTQ